MDFHFALVLARLLTVALGAIVVHLSFQSYRRNHSNGMFLLSIGFALITVGAVIAGVLFEFYGWEIFGALMVESMMVAMGFISIIYSIYGVKT